MLEQGYLLGRRMQNCTRERGVYVQGRRVPITGGKRKRIFFIRIRTEDGGIGVHGQDGGLTTIKDANGSRRRFATVLMLPNVCVMGRQRGPVQLELIDQEHSQGIQHLGGGGEGGITRWTSALEV